MTVHSPIDPRPIDPHPLDPDDDGIVYDENADLDSGLIPVPVRPRDDGWTPRRQRAFIEHLADSANVTAAARAVGMTPQSAWRLRRRPDARAFDAAWEAALERGMDRLVSIALERAIHGTMRERYYHGQVIAEERVHHNGLLLALIARGEKMLRHKPARRALREDWHAALDRLEAGAADPVALQPGRYEVWQHGDLLVTNFPPPPGFRDYSSGPPHMPGYWRLLTAQESAAHARRVAPPEAETDAAYAALFGPEGG